MKVSRTMLLVLTFAAGCSAPDGHAGQEVEDPRLMGPWVLHEPEPEPCGLAFDPDPELAAATERAAERWSAATGCVVRVETGGIPVHALPQIFIADDDQVVYTDDPNGDRRLVCGVTQHRWDIGAFAIHVATDMARCTRSIDEVVAHEVGHAFGPPATHAEDGLCADSNSPHRTSLISATTLEWACSHTACSAFVPESP